MPRPKKDKHIDEIDIVEGSPQLDLFRILDGSASTDEYSNTIELYDALPKYMWSQPRDQADITNAVITRECTLRGKRLTVKIRPAIIERKDGTSMMIYAGQREELVEDALRKLAVRGGVQMIEGRAGVTFTLYELEKELADMGHWYNRAELKEALMVCRGASIDCISDDGESVISSSLFTMVGITTRKQYLRDSRNAQCYVQFNPLVNESVLNLSFRQYNYQLGMQIRSALARFIYKRMSHYWTQAAPEAPYTPSLVSFLQQSPRGVSKRMPENVRAMKNALGALLKHNVISDYEATRLKQGNRIVDVKYAIWPHESFVRQMKKANQRQKQTRLDSLKQELAASRN